MKTSAFKGMLIRRIITIALLSVVFTGGFAIIFNSRIIAVNPEIPIRVALNAFFPRLFDMLVIVIMGLLITLGLAYFILKRAFIQMDRQDERPEVSNPDNWEFGFDQFPELKDKNKPAQSVNNAVNTVNQPTEPENHFKKELESEKLLNNLLYSLLTSHSSDKDKSVSRVLDTFGAYCKCDYAAIYKRDEVFDKYLKFGDWDADPELARHSNKVEAIDLPSYRWMNKTLSTGKSFVFRTAMLDSLMESVLGADEDVKSWLRMQAQESAEHKLCKHEGWEYFVCFPFMEGNTLFGIILVGYQKPDLPLSNEVIERLTSISSALGNQLVTYGMKESAVDNIEYLQNALNNLNDAIFVTKTDGSIVMANPAACNLSGKKRESIIGKSWNTVFPMISTDNKRQISNPLDKILRGYPSSIAISNSSLVTGYDCELKIEGMAAPIQNKKNEVTGVIFILRDITDRDLEENERCQNQKMEAVSSLSAGFAHDFNNILTAILGNISLVMDDLPANSEQASWLKAAEESTLKGKEITDKLLALAKSSPVPDTSSEAGRAIETIVIKNLADTNIKPVFQIENNLPDIRMVAATFEKIISHLVTNAVQSMKQGGILTVTAKSYEAKADNGLPLSAGRYVCIHIIDTGEGIAYENQKRVFVPYFTTKPGSSGLGLPIVYSLLKKHDGYIRIQSQPNKGTDCEIYIPVSDNDSSEQAEAKPASSRTTPLALVLDEDDALGSLLVKTMVKMGVRVQKTSDSDELSTLFFKAMNNKTPVNLILADLNIPSVTDIPGLLQIFKKSDPNVKLIAYSNDIKPDDLAEYIKQGFDDILIKPFNIAELRTVINRNITI